MDVGRNNVCDGMAIKIKAVKGMNVYGGNGCDVVVVIVDVSDQS